MIWVRAGLATVRAMAERDDVMHVHANPAVRVDEPVEAGGGALAAEAVEWNIAQVNADDVWAAGRHRRRRGGRRPGHRLHVEPPGPGQPVPRRRRRQPRLQLARRDPLRRRRLRRQLPIPLRRPRPRHPHHGHHGRRRRRRQPGRHGAGREVDRLPQHERGGRHPGHLRRVLPVVHRPDHGRRHQPRPEQGPGRHQQLLGLPAGRGVHRPQRAPDRGPERARGRHRHRPLGRQRRLELLHRHHPRGDLRRVLLGGGHRLDRRHRLLLEPRPGHGRRLEPAEAGHLRARRQHPLQHPRRRLPGGLGRHQHGRAARRRPRRPAHLRRAGPGRERRPGRGDHLAPPRCRSTTTEGCGGDPSNAVPNNTFGWGRIDAWAAYNYPLDFTVAATPTSAMVCAPAVGAVRDHGGPDAELLRAGDAHRHGRAGGRLGDLQRQPGDPAGVEPADHRQHRGGHPRHLRPDRRRHLVPERATSTTAWSTSASSPRAPAP